MTHPTRDLMGTKKRKYEEEEEDNEIEKEVANLRLEANALRKKKRIDEEVRGENLSSGLQAVEKKEALRLELSRLEREEEQEKANLALIESKSLLRWWALMKLLGRSLVAGALADAAAVVARSVVDVCVGVAVV